MDYVVTFLTYLRDQPEAVVTLLGFIAAIVTYALTSRRDVRLQKRENYLRLELESVKLFQFCAENPDIPRFLDGKIAPDESIDEKAFWYVSQHLNLFEIIIAFRMQNIISQEIFSTWVAWFYETGTAPRFEDYWTELSFHYLGELSEIMDMTLGRPSLEEMLRQGDLGPLKRFYAGVARVMKDPKILEHLNASVAAMEARIKSQQSRAAVGAQPVAAT